MSLAPVSFLAYGAAGGLLNGSISGLERNNAGGMRFQLGAPSPGSFRSSLQRGHFASVSAGLMGASCQPRFSLTRHGGSQVSSNTVLLADVAELSAADIPDIDPGDLPLDVSSDSSGVDSTELDEDEEQALARCQEEDNISSTLTCSSRGGPVKEKRRTAIVSLFGF